MKKLVLILSFLLPALACKKTNELPASYIGIWELRQYSGTIAGVNKKYPPGNGSLLQLNTDSTYVRFVNFKEVDKGTFSLKPGSINFGGTTYDGIYYNRNPGGDFITLKADSLTIGDTFIDGVVSVYVRKK